MKHTNNLNSITFLINALLIIPPLTKGGKSGAKGGLKNKTTSKFLYEKLFLKCHKIFLFIALIIFSQLNIYSQNVTIEKYGNANKISLYRADGIVSSFPAQFGN